MRRKGQWFSQAIIAVCTANPLHDPVAIVSFVLTPLGPTLGPAGRDCFDTLWGLLGAMTEAAIRGLIA